MSTLDTCKHCGGDRGIHHYATDQCPVGGCEAPIGRRQEWKSTTFEPESDNEISELRNVVKEVLSRIETLEEKVDRLQTGSELDESVRIYGTGRQS